EASLAHVVRAIDMLGALGDPAQHARAIAENGRCYSARAGKLDQALAFAAQARSVADQLDDAELRAWTAMEAEPLYYRGLWDETVRIAENALPVAWEIGEWAVVVFSSAWLAMAYLKLGQPDNARKVLDRVFSEMPARIVKVQWMAIPYAQIARAEIH